MAGIDMISGLGPTMPPRTVGAAGGSAADAADGFAQTLRSAIDGVENQQQNSAQAVQDLLTSGSGDALPVVSAMAKADLSFKLLLGVRNKVIEAYKQTMNMQV